MEIIESKKIQNIELPLQLNISFSKVFTMFKKYAEKEFEKHPFHTAAIKMVNLFNQNPKLNEGFSDLSLLQKHSELIDLLLDPLFPEPLQLNEIKAVSIPFSFDSFKFTERFKNILNNAGDDYELEVRNFKEASMYIMACTFILGSVYGFKIDLKRPLYFDIPDKTTGTMRYYRVVFNGDFSEIKPTNKAPNLTQEDFKELLNNFENINLWKEKFPPNSYIFKGFSLINLFEVTSEEMISAIKANLLAGEDDLIFKLQNNFRDFYGIKDLQLGYSIFKSSNNLICKSSLNTSNSIILNKNSKIDCKEEYFCNNILEKVFKGKETFIISDIVEYGKSTNKNAFYHSLYDSGIQSIILIPIKANENGDLALLEIASPRTYELNSVNINKLKDIIPVFETATKRISEERHNILEATIQENYTAIHQSVKWRFHEAAEKYHLESLHNDDAKLDEIIFKDVYPFFGQSDIRGSSDARNKAIKEDLITQLTLAISVLEDACKTEKIPIYNELMFRVSSYLKDVKSGLNAGDEVGILGFLNKDIYPVFNHIKKISNSHSNKVAIYMSRLDKKLKVVYEKRKEYEDSVTLLNNKLAKHIDKKQKEAQKMFPHYFERYKTDGVEYNMYIGQSITKNLYFDKLYLYNLRLWQLQTTYEMENVAYYERKNMKNDLRVASLILVHSNAMAIKFRMDEKRFDVDGAYNIRYEIVKKRIDKAHIKNTNERLTVPGKIAIVYSQEKDALEYVKYINYLQCKNQLGKLEYLQLEDLQGVSGLKALRVEVIYQKDFKEKNTISFNDILKEIQV